MFGCPLLQCVDPCFRDLAYLSASASVNWSCSSFLLTLLDFPLSIHYTPDLHRVGNKYRMMYFVSETFIVSQDCFLNSKERKTVARRVA